MNFINHQSNGVNGLRNAATVCVILGWIFLILGFIVGALSESLIFIAPLGIGIVSLGVMYFSACVIRGFASLVEAAQLYWDKNVPSEYEEE